MAIEKRLVLALPLRGEGNEPRGDELILEVDREYQARLVVPEDVVGDLRVSSEDLQEVVDALWMFFRTRRAAPGGNPLAGGL